MAIYFHRCISRPSSVEARGANCYTKGAGFESWVKHGLSVLGPTSGCVVLLSKTGRREVPGSIPDRACRPSHSEFSVVFSETRVNTGQDPLKRPPRRAFHLYLQVQRETIGFKPYKNNKDALLSDLVIREQKFFPRISKEKTKDKINL